MLLQIIVLVATEKFTAQKCKTNDKDGYKLIEFAPNDAEHITLTNTCYQVCENDDDCPDIDSREPVKKKRCFELEKYKYDPDLMPKFVQNVFQGFDLNTDKTKVKICRNELTLGVWREISQYFNGFKPIKLKNLGPLKLQTNGPKDVLNYLKLDENVNLDFDFTLIEQAEDCEENNEKWSFVTSLATCTPKNVENQRGIWDIILQRELYHGKSFMKSYGII
jgi:hypothetical protein